MVPTVEFPPTILLTLQMTLVLALPVTKAVNCCGWVITTTAACLGDTAICTAGTAARDSAACSRDPEPSSTVRPSDSQTNFTLFFFFIACLREAACESKDCGLVGTRQRYFAGGISARQS